MANEENAGPDTQSASACDVVFIRRRHPAGGFSARYRASQVMTRAFVAGVEPGETYTAREIGDILKGDPAINARFIS